MFLVGNTEVIIFFPYLFLHVLANYYSVYMANAVNCSLLSLGLKIKRIISVWIRAQKCIQ